jgi:transmembrane 9 superfamily protein 2/4
VEVGENLGEILSGDMIETSPYEAAMKDEENCKILCRREYTKAELAQFSEKIAEEYRVSWYVASSNK